MKGRRKKFGVKTGTGWKTTASSGAAMTWSLQHSIPATTNSDNHTALVYLFDVMLASLTQWTVAAHPDASAHKRKGTRTSTNLLDGTTYSEYFWWNWGSTSPTTLNSYEDATYTTTPGDLCTDTTNTRASNLNTPGAIASSSWKFWTSDVNSKAFLATRGKTIMFWEPGWTAATFYDDTWDGSVDSRRTQIFPLTNDVAGYYTGFPGPSSATTTTENVMYPAIGVSTNPYYIEASRIDMNVPWMFDGSTNAAPAASSAMQTIAFGGLGNDVGVYRPANAISAARVWRNTSNDGELFLVDGRYYLAVAGDGLNYFTNVFDMGTSEPDFS